jgi:GAF domain-containing protein
MVNERSRPGRAGRDAGIRFSRGAREHSGRNDSNPHRPALGRHLPRHGRQSHEPRLERTRAACSSSFSVEQGLTGIAIRSGITVVSNDVASDPRYLTNQETTGSELIVPVLSDGSIVGTLDIEDQRRDAFDERDQTLFERLAAALTDLYR